MSVSQIMLENVFLNSGFVLFLTYSASVQPSLVCVVESKHDWRGLFLGRIFQG